MKRSKQKKEEKHEKEKALNFYNKQYKQRCQRCGKYGHKPGNRTCPENNNKNEENKKKYEYENKKFDGICFHCGQKGHMSKDCRVWKNGSNKKFEKAEKAIDGDELVLCSLRRDNNHEKNIEKKSSVHGECKTAFRGWYDVLLPSICSKKTGSVILVRHVTSPTTKKVCLMSSRLTNQFKVASVLCLL